MELKSRNTSLNALHFPADLQAKTGERTIIESSGKVVRLIKLQVGQRRRSQAREVLFKEVNHLVFHLFFRFKLFLFTISLLSSFSTFTFELIEVEENLSKKG